MSAASTVTAGRDKKRGRPAGYAPWAPQPETRAMLDRITTILDAHGDKIGEYLVRGRRCGLIPWETIGDDRTESKVPIVCDDPEAFFAEMRQSASVYQLDRQEGQERYLEVVVEAKGAVEQVYRTTGQYGVPVYSGSGFASVTALREAVLRAEQREVPTVVLVLGDYDPAGFDIRARVAEDIGAFAAGHDGAEVSVETVALTETQVDDLGLIRAPIEAKKRLKYPWWPHDWTVELEAVTPADLAAIVAAAVKGLTDAVTRQAVLYREAEERAELMRQLRGDDDGTNEED